MKKIIKEYKFLFIYSIIIIVILLFILFAINYLANIISKYEMSGFKGNKFYANCCLIPGFLRIPTLKDKNHNRE